VHRSDDKKKPIRGSIREVNKPGRNGIERDYSSAKNKTSSFGFYPAAAAAPTYPSFRVIN
jgi:hypothetical protein